MSSEQYIMSPVCEYIQGLWPAKGWQARGGGDRGANYALKKMEL